MKPPIDYFSSDSLRHDLKGKTVRAGAWTVGNQVFMVALQFAAIPILSRLLEPADFGLVAMVTVFTGFASMFVDSGMSMATVQRENITHQQVSNLFWLSTGLGLVIALILAALSPLVAMFYDEPRLVAIMLALAISPLFGGLRIQHMALLRRAMLQKRMVMVGIVSTLLSYAMAITIAAVYHSYWALVVLPISNALFGTLAAWMACRWWPSLPKRGAGVRSMVGFGANVTGFNFINYFARSGDNLLIGWWWGAQPLGFYELAYRLMMAPLRQLSYPLQQVMIPALSRLQGEPERYRRAYFQAVGVLQVISCPLMGFVAVTAPQIVEFVFGPGYEPAGPILRWLAIAGLIQPISVSLGWLYVSQGRTREMLRWGLLGSTLVVVSFLIGLPWGPLGVARAYAAMICLVVAPLAFWFAGAEGPVTRRQLTKLTAIALTGALPSISSAFLIVTLVNVHTAAAKLCLAGMASCAATLLLMGTTKQGRIQLIQVKELLEPFLRRQSPIDSRTSLK